MKRNQRSLQALGSLPRPHAGVLQSLPDAHFEVPPHLEFRIEARPLAAAGSLLLPLERSMPPQDLLPSPPPGNPSLIPRPTNLAKQHHTAFDVRPSLT